MSDGRTNTSHEGFKASALAKQDAKLVDRCRRGDQDAWDELVDRYQKLIYSIPRRAGLSEEECNDVFQEVFVTLFEKLGELEQPERVRSWIVTTAKFKTWAVIRGRKGGPPLDEMEKQQELAALRDVAPLADDRLIELEEQHLIRTAMAGLEERCRKILSMIYLCDRPASYAEVAAEIGVGETSISPLRTRCLKKLEKLLVK